MWVVIKFILNLFFKKQNVLTEVESKPEPKAEPAQPTDEIRLKKRLITAEEVLKTTSYDSLSFELKQNLEILLDKVNLFRERYGKPLRVTSGFRSMDDHLRIYREKAVRESKVFDQSKVPMRSKHLFCQAIDVYDPSGDVKKWAKENDGFCREIGVWFESAEHTPNWCHIQSVPYGSFKEGGSLWFKP